MMDVFIAVAHAQTVGLTNPLKYKTLGDLFIGVSNFFVAFAASVATLMILYGAWKLLTSHGEEHEVTEAKHAIWYAIVGFVVVLFAAGLVSLVVNILGGGTNQSSLLQGTTGNLNTAPIPRPGRPVPFNPNF